MEPKKTNDLFLQAAWFAYLNADQRNTLDFAAWQIRHAAAIVLELLEEGE